MLSGPAMWQQVGGTWKMSLNSFLSPATTTIPGTGSRLNRGLGGYQMVTETAKYNVR
jgi:hypothetical protein